MIVSAGKAPNPPGAGYDMSGGEATEYCPPLLQSDKLLQLSSHTTPVEQGTSTITFLCYESSDVASNITVLFIKAQFY